MSDTPRIVRSKQYPEDKYEVHAEHDGFLFVRPLHPPRTMLTLRADLMEDVPDTVRENDDGTWDIVGLSQEEIAVVREALFNRGRHSRQVTPGKHTLTAQRLHKQVFKAMQGSDFDYHYLTD